MKTLHVLKKFSFVILSTFLLFGNIANSQVTQVGIAQGPQEQALTVQPVDILIGGQIDVINVPGPGGTNHYSDPCHDVAYPVQFNVGNYTNGMVIQEVVFTETKWDCTTNAVVLDTTIHYFEGWPVDGNGNVTPVDTFQWDTLAPIPVHDTFWGDGGFAGTRGCVSWTGKFAFVPNNPDGTPPVVWTPGGVGMAGGLPSTPGTNPPPFWDDLINSGTYRTRSLSVCWNCCPGEVQQWDVTSTYELVPVVIMFKEASSDEDLVSAESMDLKIYPNPANDFLNIATDKTPNNSTFLISIINVQGQSVMNQRLNLEDVQTLDISSLNQGMYILTVRNDIGSLLTQSKFVKQ